MNHPYRILITGSRTWDDYETLANALDDIYFASRATEDVMLVHGACPHGADAMAARWIRHMSKGWKVAEERHPAKDFGPWPAAGPRRNAHMVSLGADICLAFIDPCTKPGCRPEPHDSHGTAGTIKLCEAAGILVVPFRTVEAGAA